MKRRRCYTRTTATTATFATSVTIPLSQPLIQFQYAIIVGHGRLYYKGSTLKSPSHHFGVHLDYVWRDTVAVPANLPDPAEKTNSDLRSLGEALLRISRMLHEHTHKLELAVEGTYAGESSDPRVRLLSDSLRVSRTADLELGRLNQNTQHVLLTFQERLNRATESSQIQPSPISPGTKSNFEREREVLNTNISNLERKRNELETLYEIARVLNSTLEFDKVLRLVMDEVIDVVKAERGFLVLVNPV